MGEEGRKGGIGEMSEFIKEDEDPSGRRRWSQTGLQMIGDDIAASDLSLSLSAYDVVETCPGHGDLCSLTHVSSSLRGKAKSIQIMSFCSPLISTPLTSDVLT